MNPIESAEKQLERLEICNACDKISQNKKKCQECGCYLAFKIMLKINKCPLKKW